MVLQSTQGEHTRARRQCVLKIADLHTGACYEGYILHIARQKIFKDMLRHIILFSWWRQFTTDCDGINLPSLVFSPPWYLQRIYFCDDGTLNSTLVSSSFFSRENLIKSKKKLTKMHNELTKTIHGIELTSWFLGSSDSTTNDSLKFPLSSHLYLFFDMRRSR